MNPKLTNFGKIGVGKEEFYILFSGLLLGWRRTRKQGRKNFIFYSLILERKNFIFYFQRGRNYKWGVHSENLENLDKLAFYRMGYLNWKWVLRLSKWNFNFGYNYGKAWPKRKRREFFRLSKGDSEMKMDLLSMERVKRARWTLLVDSLSIETDQWGILVVKNDFGLSFRILSVIFFEELPGKWVILNVLGIVLFQELPIYWH